MIPPVRSGILTPVEAAKALVLEEEEQEKKEKEKRVEKETVKKAKSNRDIIEEVGPL